MNWLDILILIILILSLIDGFKTGIVLQITGIVALIIGLLFTGTLASEVFPYLSSIFSFSHRTMMIITYILSFIIIVLLVFLIGYFIDTFFKLPILNSVNRLLGAIFSALKWMIVISVVLFVIVKFDKHGEILTKNTKNKSSLYGVLVKVPDKLIDMVKQ